MKESANITLFRALRRDKLAAVLLAFVLFASPLFHTLANASGTSTAGGYDICSTTDRTDKSSKNDRSSACLAGRICSIANAALPENAAASAALFKQSHFVTVAFYDATFAVGYLQSEYLRPPAQAPPVQM